MSEQVLIWRQPVRDRDLPTIGKTHVTTVLARGTYDEMLERWTVADKRLRAFGLDGHVAVRSADDPQAMTDVPYSPWPSDRRARRVPVPSDKPDPVAARLAVLPGDRVKVAKYGNWYVGTVTKSALKGVTVRFTASTKKGSHVPAHRAEPDPRLPRWCRWCRDREVERILDSERFCQHVFRDEIEQEVYVKACKPPSRGDICLLCEKPVRYQHVITGWGGEPAERERRFRLWDGDVLEVRNAARKARRVGTLDPKPEGHDHCHEGCHRGHDHCSVPHCGRNP